MLETVNSGEYGGLQALLSGTPHEHSVRCLESVDVLTLSKSEFHELTASLPELRNSFERVLSKQAGSIEEGADS